MAPVGSPFHAMPGKRPGTVQARTTSAWARARPGVVVGGHRLARQRLHRMRWPDQRAALLVLEVLGEQARRLRGGRDGIRHLVGVESGEGQGRARRRAGVGRRRADDVEAVDEDLARPSPPLTAHEGDDLLVPERQGPGELGGRRGVDRPGRRAARRGRRVAGRRRPRRPARPPRRTRRRRPAPARPGARAGRASARPSPDGRRPGRRSPTARPTAGRPRRRATGTHGRGARAPSRRSPVRRGRRPGPTPARGRRRRAPGRTGRSPGPTVRRAAWRPSAAPRRTSQARTSSGQSSRRRSAVR